MTTITINTYDPEARFNMDAQQAKEFFAFVESEAKQSGYNVEFTEALQTDEESERFTEMCFQKY